MRRERHGQILAGATDGAQFPACCRALLHPRDRTARDDWVREVRCVPDIGAGQRDQTADRQTAISGHPAKAGHKLGHKKAVSACKLLMPLGTFVDSQSSNPGSIPGSATITAAITYAVSEHSLIPSLWPILWPPYCTVSDNC